MKKHHPFKSGFLRGFKSLLSRQCTFTSVYWG
ncbi:hypothetical protein VPHD518_0061 [Vibrio phage D518]